jgi:hypothetical protein
MFLSFLLIRLITVFTVFLFYLLFHVCLLSPHLHKYFIFPSFFFVSQSTKKQTFPLMSTNLSAAFPIFESKKGDKLGIMKVSPIVSVDTCQDQDQDRFLKKVFTFFKESFKLQNFLNCQHYSPNINRD